MPASLMDRRHGVCPPCARTARHRLALLVFAHSALGIVAIHTAASMAREECDCRCCRTTYRVTSLQLQGAQLMCAPLVAGEEVDGGGDCPAQCEAVGNATVVSSAQTGVVDYSRFCLLSCFPGDTNDTGITCGPVSGEDLQALRTIGGNGIDPARLSTVPAQSAPPELEVDLASAAKNASPGVPGATSRGTPAEGVAPRTMDAEETTEAETTPAREQGEAPQKATAEPPQLPGVAAGGKAGTSAVVAQAQGRLAKAVGFEARAAEAEAKSARFMANASGAVRSVTGAAHFVREVAAEVNSSSFRAAEARRVAEEAATQAAAELREVQTAPQEAASWVAEQATARFQAEAKQETAAAAANEAVVAIAYPPDVLAAAKEYENVLAHGATAVPDEAQMPQAAFVAKGRASRLLRGPRAAASGGHSVRVHSPQL
mmetsp:Transcript_123462/g.348900  ORF Transcript_123462/g.348900 Transcript_123462/m.348900 type:complete len:430 (+) Transcript_123462:110-1399(+)